MKLLECERLCVKEIHLACLVKKNHGVPKHPNRPSFGVAMNLDGEKIYSFSDGKRFHVFKNDLIFLPKGSSYEVGTLAEGDTYAINFDLATDETFEPFVIRIKNPTPLREAFGEAESAWQKRKLGYYESAMAMLYRILYDLRGEEALGYLSVRQSSMAERAKRLIAEHYTDPRLRVSDLAAACSVSEVWLRRIFRDATGLSPIEYIDTMRLGRAKDLVRAGFLNMSDIAEACGYTDYPTFCRAFRKATGLSPTAFQTQGD